MSQHEVIGVQHDELEPSDEVRVQLAAATWQIADELDVADAASQQAGQFLASNLDYSKVIGAIAETCGRFGLPFVLRENPRMRVVAYTGPADLLSDAAIATALRLVNDLSAQLRDEAVERLYREHVAMLAGKGVYPATLVSTADSARIFFSSVGTGPSELSQYLHSTNQYHANARPVNGVVVWRPDGYTFVTPGRSWMNIWPQRLQTVEVSHLPVVAAQLFDIADDKLVAAIGGRTQIALIGTSDGHLIRPLRHREMLKEQAAHSAASAHFIR